MSIRTHDMAVEAYDPPLMNCIVLGDLHIMVDYNFKNHCKKKILQRKILRMCCQQNKTLAKVFRQFLSI